jgi:hypothetical protein
MVEPLDTKSLKSQTPRHGLDNPPETFTVDCSDVVDDRESFLTCVSFLCGYCSDRYGLTAVLSADQKLKFQRLQ